MLTTALRLIIREFLCKWGFFSKNSIICQNNLIGHLLYGTDVVDGSD